MPGGSITILATSTGARVSIKQASETYGRGAQIPGAPAWMEAMKAKLLAEGGSRSTAREIYTRMYEQSTDDQVKEMASKHLMRLDSLDQRDGLRKLFAAYQTRTGKCPESWREIGTNLSRGGNSDGPIRCASGSVRSTLHFESRRVRS